MTALNAGRLTYLQLCNKLLALTDEHGYREKGSITEFKDETRLLPIYVESAWNDIARDRKNWNFLREDNFVTRPLKPMENEQITSQLLLDEDEEQVPFSHWNLSGQFRVEREGYSSMYSSLVPYDWIRSYETDTVAPGTVDYIALMPNDNLYVWPKPAIGCDAKLVVDFYRRPRALREDGDITDLPQGHEMTVVWRALMMYSLNQEETIRGAFAENEYERARSNLQRTETPPIRVYVPLM